MNYSHICKIAYRAGKKIEEIYNRDFKINFKNDSSPLTEADLESHKIITTALKELDDPFPILSEEEIVEWNVRKKWTTYWLIDPLDGTKEFINRNDEFTVNIALIHKNNPVLGVIYAPILKKLYFAYNNNGAFLIHTENGLNLDIRKKIFADKNNSNKKIRVIGSKSHGSKRFDEWVKSKFINYELIKAGSSLKFCLLAEGSADIYPRFGLTSEWDIGAACAIMSESNCEIIGIDGDITFNKKENILNPFFIAKSKYLKY